MIRFISSSHARHRGLPHLTGPPFWTELAAAETFWFCRAQSHSFKVEVDALNRVKLSPAKAACELFISRLLRTPASQWSSICMQLRFCILSASPYHPPWSAQAVKADHPSRAHPPSLCWLHSRQLLAVQTFPHYWTALSHPHVYPCLHHMQMDFCQATNSTHGEVPPERVTPGMVFKRVGVDYTGPFHLKLGCVRKPTIVKAYVLPYR